MKINGNIVIVDTINVTPDTELEDSQYFALMVTDKAEKNDKRKFLDKDKGWLGLERLGNKVYIAKKSRRKYPFDWISRDRGIPVVVEIKDTSKCRVLDEKDDLCQE